MKIAITGGTGFIGRYVVRDLISRGHEVVAIARGAYTRNTQPLDGATFVKADINDTAALQSALTGCDALAHLAGTSGDESQSLEHVHVDGVRSAVSAAENAGVKKFVLVSYLTIRPNLNSAYHTTKWRGEEIVRASKLNYTILKAGLIYGQGDHTIHNLSNLFNKLPIFATVGLREKTVRLVAVEDLTNVISAVLLDRTRFTRQTLAVVGPEELTMSQVARRIAKVMGKPFLIVLPFPVFAQRMLAWFSERFMSKPLITSSQVQMLADGVSQPLEGDELIPDDLAPKTMFTDEQIRKGLPK